MIKKYLTRSVQSTVLAITCSLSIAGVSNVLAMNDKDVNRSSQASSPQWEDYLELLKEKDDAYLKFATVQSSMDTLPQYMMMALAQGYMLLSRADPDYPEFTPLINHIYNVASPNPDTVYYYATLDGRNTYRIYGTRGTVSSIDFQLGYDFLGFASPSGKNLSATLMDEFSVNEDGTFEILVSAKKPDSWTGNWLKMDERANYMLVRQQGYHPDEVDARMGIEKIDGPEIERKTMDSDAFVRAIIDYVGYSADFLYLHDNLETDYPVNQFVTPNFSTVGGVINQIYQHTLYDIGLDEALIITFKVPDKCRYWNIQANDTLMQVHDFLKYQSSLNGYIDRRDSDGLTRIVVSHKDPRAANWLDVNQVENGHIQMRWIDCGSDPKPVIEKIPFADIEKKLPEDTQWLSPDERAQELRSMRQARQMRRYW